MVWRRVDYCDVFTSCLDSFWRHPFTAEDPLISKWCNTNFLFCSDEEKKSSTSWMASGWVHFQFCLGWTIHLIHSIHNNWRFILSYYAQSPSYCECGWWRKLGCGSLLWSLGGGCSHGCMHPSAGSPAALCNAELDDNTCFPLPGSALGCALIQRRAQSTYTICIMTQKCSCNLQGKYLILTHPLVPLMLSKFLHRHAERNMVHANINATKWK